MAHMEDLANRSVSIYLLWIGGIIMPGNIFYIIGVVVVVLVILGYLGLR